MLSTARFPDPGMERRRPGHARGLIVLVAIVVIGYALGAMVWLDLDAVEPAVNSRERTF